MNSIIYCVLFNPTGGEDVAPELLVEAAFTTQDLVEVTTVEGGVAEEGEDLGIDYGPEWLHEVEYEGIVVGLVEVAAGGIKTGVHVSTYGCREGGD